jgi:hypothetical protein
MDKLKNWWSNYSDRLKLKWYKFKYWYFNTIWKI